jgi:predicted nucleic acid-binding protein
MKAVDSMQIVLDASCALAALLPDEAVEHAARLVEDALRAGAVVPTIWRLEVINGTLQAHRRGRFDRETQDLILSEFAKVEVAVDNEGAAVPWRAVTQLAARHRLSAYDACYLELALRRTLPLATLDLRLRSAAEAEAIEVL